MKIFLSIILSAVIFSSAFAQDKYEQTMKKNIVKIDESKTVSDYVKLGNSFERIALAEKDKWLPFYYTSFVYVLASYIDSSSAMRDMYLDKSVELARIADSLAADNSEILTLKGMIAQARMQIDPMSRWQKYGSEADANFRKAIKADSLNPRPEYLIGIGTYYTPVQFGGGADNARPILERSMKKYEQFVPADDLMPNWGKEAVETLLEISEINNKE